MRRYLAFLAFLTVCSQASSAQVSSTPIVTLTVPPNPKFVTNTCDDTGSEKTECSGKRIGTSCGGQDNVCQLRSDRERKDPLVCECTPRPTMEVCRNAGGSEYPEGVACDYLKVAENCKYTDSNGTLIIGMCRPESRPGVFVLRLLYDGGDALNFQACSCAPLLLVPEI